MNNQATLTEKEIKLLNIIASDGEMRLDGMGYVGNLDIGSWDLKSFGGVLGSLAKKGFVQVDGIATDDMQCIWPDYAAIDEVLGQTQPEDEKTTEPVVEAVNPVVEALAKEIVENETASVYWARLAENATNREDQVLQYQYSSRYSVAVSALSQVCTKLGIFDEVWQRADEINRSKE